MRIGLVTATYEPVLNGVTQMVAGYKKELLHCGHEVTIFTIGHLRRMPNGTGVEIARGVPIGKTGYHLAVRYPEAIQKKLATMDVIHCHHLVMGLELAHRYARCPIVFTNHTRYDLYAAAYTPLPQGVANTLLRLAWPRLTRLCDVVIAPSESARRILREFGVRRPIRVIPNGIQLDRFRRPVRIMNREHFGFRPASVVVIYLGRLSAEKRPDRLIDQFSEAARANADLVLLVVGDGPMKRALRRQVERLGLSRRIVFAGRAEAEDVPGILACGDLFATASVSEIHPLTLIEAMASGLPVIGYRSPGVSDIVRDGVSGLLVDEDERNLALAMLRAAGDLQLRENMRRKALRLSRRYSLRNTVIQTLDLYEELLDTRDRLEKPIIGKRRRDSKTAAPSGSGPFQNSLPELAPGSDGLFHSMDRREQ